MSGTLRLFVAVALPDDAKDAVDRACDRPRRTIGSKVSWVAPGNYHLTLKFLGAVAADRVPELDGALAAASRPVPPFTLSLEGVGAFPSWKAPRVLWVGVAGELEVFRRLAGRVDRLCGEVGFAREARDASPHLTLARRRDPGPDPGLREAMRPMEAFSHAPFPVTEVLLMESRLLPGGASYGIVRTYTLSGDHP